MGDVKAVENPLFLYSGQCKFAPDAISQHRVSVQCMEELFNLTVKGRVEYELSQLERVKTVGPNNTLDITST